MYLTYERYKQLGGTLTQEGFGKAEPIAELYMNHWTLNRLKSERVIMDLKAAGDYESVERAMAYLADEVEGLRKSRKSKADGAEVTSFSNGVNSFSFGGAGSSTEVTAAEASAHYMVCAMLPIELVSACVSYNDAR